VDLAAAIERDEELRPVVRAAGGDGVWLVGGAVRDLLLGRRSPDVDLVVEGDAGAVAQELASALDGRLVAHDAFGTAVVEYGDGRHVDVATARRESYDAPAALPRVEPAPIDEDLARRDFTINAIALSLADGRLLDPFGGVRDVDAGTIRVLHDRSFVDDPTRILRALRYEGRLGFRMDRHTEALARSAAPLVEELSGARLREELVALLDEADIRHAVLRLAELRLLPQLAADEQAVTLRDRLVELRDRYAREVPRFRLGLLALARHVRDPRALVERLALARRDAEALAAAVTEGPRLAERLAAERLQPADVAAAVERRPPDVALYALALGGAPALRDWFERLRDVRLAIGGRELAELGLAESPRVGEILAELRRRKLNGELDGREAELAAARALIAQER
jgi:tRNA nucleotidyltransferase (CCA-adding enzyme)